jgi:deoxyhypusine monooxygenase
MLSLQNLRSCLIDLDQPVAKRTNAAFHLRTLASDEAVAIIIEAIKQRKDSSLMRHELAYILGQIGSTKSCDTLSKILIDETEDLLVRHESAEALGAIGEPNSVEILKLFTNHCYVEIAETCQIAIDLIEWKNSNSKSDNSVFLSVDPAPPFQLNGENCTALSFQKILMDESESLFNRYRAMFSLRNMNSDESSLSLLEGFKDKSALFRHEIAYVLGQMQRPVTINGLVSVLANLEEHRMVRHEAAEALGAIGGKEVEDILNNFKNDVEPVVEESCLVALDNMDYWLNFKND